jgi:hypothetical protein
MVTANALIPSISARYPNSALDKIAPEPARYREGLYLQDCACVGVFSGLEVIEDLFPETVAKKLAGAGRASAFRRRCSTGAARAAMSEQSLAFPCSDTDDRR